MRCVITVKGDGRGRYGKLKNDKTGPVESFLVDSDFLYSEVTKHVFGPKGGSPCPHCDPEEILRFRLARRLSMVKKFDGMTAQSLVKHVLSWEKRLAKTQRPLPKDLVDEFVWRQGAAAVVEHRSRLSVRQKFDAFRIDKYLTPERVGQGFGGLSGLTREEQYLARLAKDPKVRPADDAELEDLIKVAEVMLS